MANEYDLRQQELDRRRERMNSYANQPMSSGQMIGRVFVPASPLEHIAKLATAWMAGQENKEYEGKSKAIQSERRADLMKQLEGFDSSPDQQAAAREALVSAHPEMQQLGQILLQRRLSPAKKEEKWTPLSSKQKQEMGLPVEDAYQIEETSGKIAKLDNATRVTTNVNTPTPEGTYQKKRAEGEADMGNKLAEAAQQSQPILRALDQMEAYNSAGVFSGPTAGIQDFLTGLAKTAGIEVDSAKLANSQAYQAQLFNNVISSMAQMGGAKGFAKEETEMLLKSFPLLQSSPEARQQIINILRNRALQVQENYKKFREWESGQFPDVRVFEGSTQMAPSRPSVAPEGAPKGPTVSNW